MINPQRLPAKLRDPDFRPMVFTALGTPVIAKHGPKIVASKHKAATKKNPYTTYTVRRGNKLSDIAAAHGVHVEAVVRANPNLPTMVVNGRAVFKTLHEGQRLNIPAAPRNLSGVPKPKGYGLGDEGDSCTDGNGNSGTEDANGNCIAAIQPGIPSQYGGGGSGTYTPPAGGASIGDSCSSDGDCDSGNCFYGYCAPSVSQITGGGPGDNTGAGDSTNANTDGGGGGTAGGSGGGVCQPPLVAWQLVAADGSVTGGCTNPSNVPGGATVAPSCPPGSLSVFNGSVPSCQCQDGSAPDPTNGCPVTCGQNSHSASGQCYCDDGYTWASATGVDCVKMSTPTPGPGPGPKTPTPGPGPKTGPGPKGPGPKTGPGGTDPKNAIAGDKTWMWIAGAVAAAAIVGGGGYYLYAKKKPGAKPAPKKLAKKR